MRWLQSNQQMDMVFNAADFQRLAVELVHDPAKVFVQSSTPRAFDPWLTMFGGKSDVKIDAVERGHRSASGEWMIFDPSGIRLLCIQYPVVTLRLPPAIF